MPSANAPVVRVDDSQLQVVLLQLTKTGEQTAALALNRTSEDVLADQRPKIKAAFIVRNEAFFLPPLSVPLAHRAKPGRLYVPVALAFVDGSGSKASPGERKQHLLDKHGAAQTINAKDPIFPFFLPTPALRSNKGDVIARSKYPRNLVGRFDENGSFTGLGRTARIRPTRRRVKRRGLMASLEGAGIVGKQYKTNSKQVGRYFLLGKPGERMYGVYERTGSGKTDLRMLWWFRPNVTLKKRIDFENDAQRVIGERWPVNYAGAFDQMASRGLTGFGAGKPR